MIRGREAEQGQCVRTSSKASKLEKQLLTNDKNQLWGKMSPTTSFIFTNPSADRRSNCHSPSRKVGGRTRDKGPGCGMTWGATSYDAVLPQYTRREVLRRLGPQRRGRRHSSSIRA